MKTTLLTLAILALQPLAFASSFPLEEAAHNSDVQAVKRLIKEGVDVNQKNKHEPSEVADGKTALMIASNNGDTEIVKLLLEAGAKVNLKDSDGSGALYMAAVNGHADIVDLLLAAKADPNEKTATGYNILMMMAMHPAEENLERIVKALIAAGLNPNATDESGNTALHLACDPCEEGQFIIATILLKNGAKLDIKNKDGKTPKDIAKTMDNGKAMLELFSNHKS